jgi:predicted lipoprotein with Yx(FWY)xxD motif
MPAPQSSARRRRPPWAALVALAAVAGAALAAFAGLAVAKSFTLKVAKNASVITGTSTKSKAIATNSAGRAVYWLSGDSKRNSKCTQANQCLTFWPAVTVKSATSKPTAMPGIKGKLGVWHRGKIFQVTLGGHPLYTFVQDKTRNAAHGDGLKSFGGTWHVVTATVAASGSTTTGGTTSTSTTTSPAPTMSTPGYTYPPGY